MQPGQDDPIGACLAGGIGAQRRANDTVRVGQLRDQRDPYAGERPQLFSRGAMLTTVIATASGVPDRRQAVDGGGPGTLRPPRRPLRGDARDQRRRALEVGLGLLGGSLAVLVRSGITGAMDLSRLPEGRRPHAVVNGVEDLLPWL